MTPPEIGSILTQKNALPFFLRPGVSLPATGLSAKSCIGRGADPQSFLSVNGGVKFGHCGGANDGQFGASALERAALI